MYGWARARPMGRYCATSVPEDSSKICDDSASETFEYTCVVFMFAAGSLCALMDEGRGQDDQRRIAFESVARLGVLKGCEET